MKITRPIYLAILLTLVGTPCFAQTWSYQGSQMCYQSGPGSSMCFSQGTIASTASNLSYQQNVSQNYAAGQAIGSLVGGLIRAWIDHHRRVVAETKALKEELLTYLDAEVEAFTEAKGLESDNADQLVRLKSLDQANANTWEAAEKIGREQILPTFDKQIQLALDHRELVVKQLTDRKVLDRDLNDKKIGAKALYEQYVLRQAALANAKNQLFRGLVGYFENQAHLQQL